MEVSYVIKNGRVIDVARGIDEVRDVYIKDDRIVEPEESEGRNCNVAFGELHVVDATGCLVTPGLVDHHLHCFHSGSGLGIQPDAVLSSGVTSAIDAGTAGTSTFDAFYRGEMSHAALRLKAYLTPYAGGQLDMGINEDFDPAKYNRNRIARLVDGYRDKLLGLKIRLQYGIEPTEKARDYMQGVIDLANEMTERTGVPLRVCVHTTDCQLSAGELAGMLRPGDIFTHCFQGKRHNLVLDDGTIDPGVLEARERGVIFDACNGMGNYGVDVCKKALSQDFFPDVISSDETIEKCNLPMYTKSLPFIASKYLSLGMDFHEVFRAMTQTPAKLMDMEGRIGTLAPGAYADVAIFKYRTDLEVRHVDSLGVEFVGHDLLVPQMTFLSGEPVYCYGEFNL